MFLSFQTDKSGQTVQTQIRLLLVWPGSTLFANPSASFECITLRKSHPVKHLGWLQQIFGCPNFKAFYGNVSVSTKIIFLQLHLFCIFAAKFLRHYIDKSMITPFPSYRGWRHMVSSHHGKIIQYFPPTMCIKQTKQRLNRLMST